jgi:hypothetical protein
MRVAVTFAKAGIGPGRTQSTLGAVSIKAPIKAAAFETMVAETAMAHLYGPALRCSVAAETAVVRLDPGDSESVVVRRDPMACETGAAKTANMTSAAKTKTTETKTADVASAAKTKTADVASAAKTKTTDVASAAKTKTANMASAAKTKTTDVASAPKTKTTDVASAPKTKTTDVASAAQATDMASAAKATAPCERDCAGRCCGYAEHDGRTCCNQPLTHFSELLMFHLIWIASVQSLYSSCCDWFTIAPIWKDRQNQEVVQGMPLRAIARGRLVSRSQRLAGAGRRSDRIGRLITARGVKICPERHWRVSPGSSASLPTSLRSGVKGRPQQVCSFEARSKSPRSRMPALAGGE